MRHKFILLFISCFFAQVSFAQNGSLDGVLKDASTNESLAFANIFVKATQTGTTTDIDGVYSLPLPAGTYTIVFNYVGYETVEVTDIVIKADEHTSLDVSLKSSANEIEEVVVTAKQMRNTESSVLKIQQRSINLIDGLSAQNFKKIGASSLASAVKNIPGISVQGGKYVYVRGLGDRYTKTILNGVDIPGLDPDRNTIQMDIFPTNILDNIIVVKSFTADLPADFTGGVVDIVTKDYPVQKEFSFSVSGAYNPSMHFNSNYLDYQGGRSDFLGYDDGTRKVAINPNNSIPNTFDRSPLLTELTKRFDPTLSARKAKSGMDYSFGITGGNQYIVGKKKKNKIGFISSVAYKNETKFYKNAENNFYRKDPDTSVLEMPLSKSQKGNLGENNVTLTGLAALSFKTAHSKYKINLLHIQNGESTAGLFTQVLNESDFIQFKKDNLAYTQRSISNAQFSATHTNKDYSLKTVWQLSSTLSKIYDKDIRTTAFQVEESAFSIAPNNEPKRIWRNLQEENHVAKLDFTKKYQLLDKPAKLKFGTYGSYKQRVYSIYTFQIGIAGRLNNVNGNADKLLSEDNLWTVQNQNGTFLRNRSVADPANVFQSNQLNFAGYASNEFIIGSKLKTIVGLRLEKFMLQYTGKNTTGTAIYDNQRIIDKFDLFPSANFIYSLSENKNIRLSYTRTTARPSFKEASIAEIFDPLSNITYIGNINIKPTYINNLDLRFEIFGNDAQMLAVSAFYKSFTDPIELTYFQSALNNFTPKNLGSANVYGIELEFRKNLAFISPSLKNLKIKANTSFIKSELQMGKDELTLRKNTARTDEIVESTRVLQGQSPYLFNAGLDYDKADIGLQVGLYYNVQGKTLEMVGGANPDVYTMPFGSLNFVLNKTFGKKNNSNFNIKVANILGNEKLSVYQSYNAQDQIFSKRNIGTAFSVGYGLKF